MINAVNFVFVHDNNILNLFKQKSSELNSNLLNISKFVCARNPELTDFTYDGGVINAYEDKYKELNGILRLQTGVMNILDRPELLESYDYIGFQRCSIIYDFPLLNNPEMMDNTKYYFTSWFMHKSRSCFIKDDWNQWWQDMIKNSIVPIYKIMLDNSSCFSTKLIDFLNWFMFDSNKKFFYSVNIFTHKNNLDTIRYINTRAMDIWFELNKFVKLINYDNKFNIEFLKTLDMYDSIQEYLYNTVIDSDYIDVCQKKELFNFTDAKYHCRWK